MHDPLAEIAHVDELLLGVAIARGQHLATALEAHEELPRSLDIDVFGMFDELVRLAVARRKAKAASAEGDDAETPAPTEDAEPT